MGKTKSKQVYDKLANAYEYIDYLDRNSLMDMLREGAAEIQRLETVCRNQRKRIAELTEEFKWTSNTLGYGLHEADD